MTESITVEKPLIPYGSLCEDDSLAFAGFDLVSNPRRRHFSQVQKKKADIPTQSTARRVTRGTQLRETDPPDRAIHFSCSVVSPFPALPSYTRDGILSRHPRSPGRFCGKVPEIFKPRRIDITS